MKAEAPGDEERVVRLTISETVYQLLAVLDQKGSVEEVLYGLIDHVQGSLQARRVGARLDHADFSVGGMEKSRRTGRPLRATRLADVRAPEAPPLSPLDEEHAFRADK